MTTHYQKRRSLRKRVRKFGFRARMKTRNGRKLLSRRRRIGSTLAVRRSF